MAGGKLRWTEERGVEELPYPPSASYVSATGISSDGRWTVGGAKLDGILTPVRWDGLSSPELLAVDPTLPDSCWVVDVTADGGRIAGFCFNVDNHDEQAAVLWTQETGMVSLQDLLVSDYKIGGRPGRMVAFLRSGYHRRWTFPCWVRR